MLQSKQRLLQLNAKLAETLTNKGVTATADETTTSLVNKVGDITSGDTIYFSENGRMYTKNIILPEGLTEIGGYAYHKCVNLESAKLPYGVGIIGDYAFSYCESLTSINIPNSVTSIGNYAFYVCSNLTSITIPNSVPSIGKATFSSCTSLTNIIIPNSVTRVGEGAFQYCSSLTNVTLGNGFNANNLNLSASTKYTAETIVSWFNALTDRTGQTAYKLIIGATNLAKLTEQDILIATNKNWTLA